MLRASTGVQLLVLYNLLYGLYSFNRFQGYPRLEHRTALSFFAFHRSPLPETAPIYLSSLWLRFGVPAHLSLNLKLTHYLIFFIKPLRLASYSRFLFRIFLPFSDFSSSLIVSSSIVILIDTLIFLLSLYKFLYSA